MKLVAWDVHKHYPIVTKWLRERKHPIPDQEEFPEVGCLAFEDGLPVAAGFIRMVEGGYGQIDGLVTSPGALAPVRHDAINEILDKLVDMAQCLGVRQLFAFTSIDSVKRRAVAIGMKQAPVTAYVLPLEPRRH